MSDYAFYGVVPMPYNNNNNSENKHKEIEKYVRPAAAAGAF